MYMSQGNKINQPKTTIMDKLIFSFFGFKKEYTCNHFFYHHQQIGTRFSKVLHKASAKTNKLYENTLMSTISNGKV